jgi:predicted nucleotidyltransferase
MWLKAYRKEIEEHYSRCVVRMLIYGSKARGEDRPDSDLDVLLIVKDDAGRLKRQLRRVGYLLATSSDVLPSILAYTEAEWERRDKSGSAFRRAVDRDGVQVR